MAATLPLVQHEPIDIQTVIYCVWCKEGIKSTLFKLGCFHAGCRPCLELMLIDLKAGSNFKCPVCNADGTVPENGVDGFPVEKLQTQAKKIADIESDTYPNCGMCEIENEITSSTHFCVTCDNHLCTKDSRRHPFGNGHVVFSHEELKAKGKLSKMLPPELLPCQEHSPKRNSKLLKFFCTKCETPLCSGCVTSNHVNHEKISLKEAASKYKHLLRDKVAKIKTEYTNVNENVKNLEKNLSDIQDNVMSLTFDFKKWGEDMKNCVDEMVNEHLENVEHTSSMQRQMVVENLQKQTDKLKQFEIAEQYMDVLQNYGSDSHFLEEYKNYVKALDKYRQHEEKKVPVQMFEVLHKDAEENKRCLKELFGDIKKIGSKVTESKDDASDGVLTKWKTGCRYGVTIVDKDIVVAGPGNTLELYEMNGKGKGAISCKELLDAGDVGFLYGEIFVTDNEKRRVLVMDRHGSVTKRVELPRTETSKTGYLGLGLDKTNGDLYVSSASTDTVYKCQRGGAGFTPFIFGKLHGPHYICVTSRHECIVSSQLSIKVTKFSSSGHPLWEYGRNKLGIGKLNGPYGVCVDERDHCFVVDHNSSRIHEINPQGELISYVNVEEEMSFPMAIAVANDSMVVTQRNNTIHVFKYKN